MVSFAYSTVTLFAEVIVTSIVLYVFYEAYSRHVFHKWLVAGALTYEVLFNISYMVISSVQHVATDTGGDTALQEILAIAHGTLSLIMFVALIVYLVLAWRGYNKGRNYFREHKALTWTFVIFWLLAILSGIVFYFVIYF